MGKLSLDFVLRGQVSSLAFLVYEICVTFDDEVNIIWSKPNNSWIKWQFLFTRYFALASQILNRTIEHIIITDTHMSVSNSLKNWFRCQVIVGSLLMSAVEMVLMARVYALYQRNSHILLVFCLLIVGEFIVVIVGVLVNKPGPHFHLSNFLLTSPMSYTYFGMGAIVSQITILVLTLAKYKSALRGGWGKAPIVMLMVRDGTAAFLFIIIVTALTVVASKASHQYPPIGNSWFVSIVACAGGRLVLNMQNLPNSSPHELAPADPTTVQLTTLWNGFEERTSTVLETS